MKVNDCSIVQDLLPLYIEDMLRPDTTTFVEDHLSGCQTCTAALGDLKTDTASPVPKAEEARQGDKRILKAFWKKLTLQSSIIEILGVVYFILHCFPWVIPQNIKGGGPHSLPLLLFTSFPLYIALSEVFRSAHTRNKALAATGLILPLIGLPLFLLVANMQTAAYDFFQGKYDDGPWQHDNLWSLFSSMFHPALLLLIVCGLLITGVSLYNIWSKHFREYPPSADKRLRINAFLTAFFTSAIIILHFFPIYSHENANVYPFTLINLFYGAIPLYLSLSAAFCKTTHLKATILATALALPLPVFATWPILALLFPSSFSNYFWMDSYTFAPLYYILFLSLSLCLSATAICSVWYKWKQQTEEDLK